MGVACYPVEQPAEIAETLAAAADLAFEGGQAAAVLIGQRVIGAKSFAMVAAGAGGRA
jgi:hypothetical protein